MVIILTAKKYESFFANDYKVIYKLLQIIPYFSNCLGG